MYLPTHPIAQIQTEQTKHERLQNSLASAERKIDFSISAFAVDTWGTDLQRITSAEPPRR
jgi:hypothetical protein